MTELNLSQSINWRSQLQRNQRRTAVVIAMFILLYVAIGFMVDIVLYSHRLAIAYPGYSFDVSFITDRLITFQPIPYATLIMAAVAIISLLITYQLYDRIMLLGTEYHQVTLESARTLAEKQLYNIVEELKVAAGLRYMPRVFIIAANYMNAFASGYSEKSAMVAITRGLMEKLDRNELQAVMAHELSHVRHLDIKLTLTASVLSNLLLIVVDILFYNLVYNRDRRVDQRLVFLVMLLRYLLPITTLLLLMYLSRTREYMADAGCVELMRDNKPLASALLKIHRDYSQNKSHYQQTSSQAHEEVRRAAYLYDPAQAGLMPFSSINQLFSTHPDIKDRLAALGFKYED